MITPAHRMTTLETETAFAVLARAGELAADGKSIINLGIGQPDFAPAPHITAAAEQAIRDGHHGYTPAPGIPALREAVSADLSRRYGATVDPARVLVVPGGKVTMFFAALMMGEPGTEILYPDPGFPIYRSVAKFSGATPVPYPLTEDRGFAFSAEDVLSRLTDQTRLLMINTPANPTGGVVPKEEIDKLVAGLTAFPKVVLMADEIYSQMAYENYSHTTLLDYPEIQDRLILLEGWSKTYAMTGWRLGYGIWPESLIGYAERLAVNSHSCVNAVAQHAALAALTGPQDAVQEMVSAFAKRRRLIVDRLNGIPGFRCVEPGGAFYAFPNIEGTGLDEKTLQQRLLEETGVAVIHGTSFGDWGKGYLRFSYAASEAEITEASDRIDAFVATL